MAEHDQTYTVDKSGWGFGPWGSEPDKVNWVDPETDLDCMIVRQENHGAWCGYVGVPPEHPLHGKSDGECSCDKQHKHWDCDAPFYFDLDVHGGVTYANGCDGHVCHVPEPGRPHDVWWIGFDCCHGGDFAPGIGSLFGHAVYRDAAYVRSQCQQLARQIALVDMRPAIPEPEPEPAVTPEREIEMRIEQRGAMLELD